MSCKFGSKISFRKRPVLKGSSRRPRCRSLDEMLLSTCQPAGSGVEDLDKVSLRFSISLSASMELQRSVERYL